MAVCRESERAERTRPSLLSQAAKRASSPAERVSALPAAAPVSQMVAQIHGRATAGSRSRRTSLPSELKNRIEALSGIGMNDVRVHWNSSEPAELDAHAFARGSEIHLAPGQDRHLLHEAWHVVQQKQGRVPPTREVSAGVPVNDDADLEHEADRMSARATGAAPGQLAPAAPSSVVGRSAAARRPVVQRWLRQDLLTGQTADNRRKALAQQANAYNADRRGKTLTMRINQIEALHAAILTWLDQYHSPDQEISSTARWVKALNNEVQTEHQLLIKLSVAAGGDPPVANFASLLPGVQRKVRRTWQQLVAGAGNVRIAVDPQDALAPNAGAPDQITFRDETLAQFARLLSTEAGRTIVAKVNAGTGGQKLVTIVPGSAAAGDEFAAGPVAQDNSDQMTELPALPQFTGQPNAKHLRAAYRNSFVPLDLGAIADPKAKAKAIYAAREANPNAPGLVMGGKYFLFGAGTGANVTITRDIRDSSEHHSARFVDSNRDEIPTPNFITLGHELGHAAHMIRGVALGNQGVSDYLLPKMGEGAQAVANWSHMEEYGNIHAAENSLRAAYGLRPRFGHINQATVQKSRLLPIVNELYTLKALRPGDPPGPVSVQTAAANTALGGLQIGQARTAIAAAVTSFSSNLASWFPAFTVNENAAIVAALQPVPAHVASADGNSLAAALASLQQAVVLVTNAKLAHPAPVPPVAAPSMFGRLRAFLGF